MRTPRLLTIPCLLFAVSLFACDDPDEDDPALAEDTFSVFTGTSLPGSIFEIDNDANLVVDDNDGMAPQRIDWASVSEQRRADAPTGQNDDSFQGGAKEDDECPATTTGSIPNNKSDLLNFGTYRELGSGPLDPGFLHMFWTRVTDPNGTTLMDFEFNQSPTVCANGSPGSERMIDDVLLEYRIEQGGATAQLRIRRWTGSAWGPEQLLGSTTTGTGTINTSPIAAASSDGLLATGSMAARTFGEASIDLDEFFDATKCTTFTSVFVKSRSSTSFTSQMKDFIAPLPLNLSNCATVKIRKQTTPDGATEQFGFTHDLVTDPAASSQTFNLQDDGEITFTNVLLNTAGDPSYVVTENTVPSNWVLDHITCTNTGVTTTTSVPNKNVTFALDNPADVVDCTFYNRLQRGSIEVVKTRKHAASGTGDHPHAGVTFTLTGTGVPPNTTAVTDANGKLCFPDLAFGSYTVTETVPSGYAAAGMTAKAATVSAEGDCDPTTELAPSTSIPFANIPLTDFTVSVNSQVDGGTASTISCTQGMTGVGSGSTGANGDGSITVSNRQPGSYTCTIVIDP